MILVTGATGTVGTELVPQLLAAGESVRVLVRDAGTVAHLLGRVEVAVGDLDQPASLPAALAGVRNVYAITARPAQMEAIIDAGRRAGVERLVRQSTFEAGADPPLGPGRWHRECELLVERSGLAWTHVRPTMFMSNTVQWWAASIRGQSAVFFPGGDGRVSPVDPRDIAAVAAAALTRPDFAGRAYDVTGPELLTVGEMVAIRGRVLGRPLRYVDVPETAAAEGMAKAGLPPYVVAGLVETLGALRGSRFAYVAPTVELVTGAPGRTYEAWCQEHRAAFE
jgi:uncharacterized protein YbjT (DUF2867 family)